MSVDSRGLSHQDCEVLFHVNKQSSDIAGGVHVDRDVFHVGNGARTAASSTTPKHTAAQTMATTTEGRRRKREGKERGKEEVERKLRKEEVNRSKST